MTEYIGVDPGVSGAIAWIKEDGTVEFHEYPDDIWTLMKLLKGARGVTAVLEKVHMLPQDRRSVRKAEVLIRSHERLRVCLTLAHAKLLELESSHWRKAAGYDGRSDKSQAITKAIQLYPSAANQIYYKSRNGRYAQKDGRAEALLMAHAGKLIETKVESLF